jgi:hypothetical protein
MPVSPLKMCGCFQNVDPKSLRSRDKEKESSYLDRLLKNESRKKKRNYGKKRTRNRQCRKEWTWKVTRHEGLKGNFGLNEALSNR